MSYGQNRWFANLGNVCLPSVLRWGSEKVHLCAIFSFVLSFHNYETERGIPNSISICGREGGGELSDLCDKSCTREVTFLGEGLKIYLLNIFIPDMWGGGGGIGWRSTSNLFDKFVYDKWGERKYLNFQTLWQRSFSMITVVTLGEGGGGGGMSKI